jgi:hypothetical protein
MMGFKAFVSERSIDALVQSEPSDLKAQLSSIEGVLSLMLEGPKKAKLNRNRLQFGPLLDIEDAFPSG